MQFAVDFENILGAQSVLFGTKVRFFKRKVIVYPNVKTYVLLYC